MLHESKSLDHRRITLEGYIARRLNEGFRVVSQGDTSAELYRPAGFPAFLRKPQSIYVQVDEQARLWLRKTNY